MAFIVGRRHPCGKLIQIVVQGFGIDRGSKGHGVDQFGHVDKRKGRITAVQQQTVPGLDPSGQIGILHSSTPLPRGSLVYPIAMLWRSRSAGWGIYFYVTDTSAYD